MSDRFSFIDEIYFRGEKAPETALDCSGGSIRFPTSSHMHDVSDCQRFGFIISAGALAHTLIFQVKQATSKAEGDLKDIENAKVEFSASEDNAYKIIEVGTDQLDINQAFQYVSLEVSGGSTNDFGAIHFYKLRPGERPVVQDAASANGNGWYAGSTILV